MTKTVPKKLSSIELPHTLQLTLEYSNSSFLRLTLPDLRSTELVQLSIDAVCHVLGRELSTSLRARWYACRNAPGPPCLSPIKEWKLFVHCLLGMMGYRADHFMLIPTDTETPATAREEGHSALG